MMEVTTIFDSDREEYEFMQQKKEKPMKEQIEEMAKAIDNSHWRIEQGFGGCHINSTEMAENLYNAGYRKKKEVIDEFVEMLLDKYDIWTDNDILEYNYVSKLARRVAEEMKGGAE